MTPTVRPSHRRMQRAMTLWMRYAPGTWVPVAELRAVAEAFGWDSLELAIEQLGERTGELSLDRLKPILLEIASDHRREDQREVRRR